ncbi:hypothetical protein Taro_022259 [Colocasia esculenta]|uniref:Retrotransposon gag domain-containing protein n=1 Tax=Colocasia esculenta TaxID=4460 RepID=A0A843V158_COLES|nr:hypothetical protein [Colocasia esculenta]
MEEERVTLATYMLQERANVWWSSVLRTQFGDGAMEGEVHSGACAGSHRARVSDIDPRSMSVLEYEARFAELSKYAPHIVADERRKVKKFIMGLKPSLRTRLVGFVSGMHAGSRDGSIPRGEEGFFKEAWISIPVA